MHRPAALVRILVAVCLCGAGLAAQDATTFKDDNARDLFTRSRMAVGAQHVAQLTALTMRGKSRSAVDEQVADGAVEIKILLPDCYVREDHYGSMTRRTGFCGNALLTANIDNGQASTPPASMTSGLLAAERARLTRLLLGATTYVSSRYALTFRSSGGEQVAMTRPTAAVQTTGGGGVEAYRLEVAGDQNFGAQFVVDSASYAPAHIDTLISKRVLTTTFADRREVSGLKLPFHITTSSGGKMVDDLILDAIVVNAPLTKEDFKAR